MEVMAKEPDLRMRTGYSVVTNLAIFVAYNRPYPTRMRDTIIAAFAMNCLIHVGVVFYDVHVKKKRLKSKKILTQVGVSMLVSIAQGAVAFLVTTVCVAIKKREQKFMLEKTQSLLERARDKQWKPVVYVLDWWVTSSKKNQLPADY